MCLTVTGSGVMAAGHLCMDHHGEVTQHVHGKAHCHEDGSHATSCGGACSHGGGLAHEAEAETCDCAYGPLDTSAALPVQPETSGETRDTQPIGGICRVPPHATDHLSAAAHLTGGKRSVLTLTDLQTVVLRL